MSHTPNPIAGVPAPPPVSRRTVPVAGLLVDFYGLDELPADTESVTMLWLHHPRLGSRATMASIGAIMVHSVGEAAQESGRRHRLVAAAFDQRNHGSRLVSERANGAWREGNPTHAQDMFGTVAGMVADTRLLMDLFGGYHEREETGTKAGDEELSSGALPGHVAVTQHVVLGVSLGGHSGWQLLFADDRVTAGVLIIGCPDYMDLMFDRARLSKLPTYNAAATPEAARKAFFGSRDFPAALVAACCKHDPKGIVFGADAAAWPSSDDPDRARKEQALHDVLKKHVAGKRFLICSGGADKLVPYARSAAFTAVFKQAAATWRDLALTVDDRVYEGVGHAFSAGMVQDAVQFVKETVAGAPPAARATASKI